MSVVNMALINCGTFQHRTTNNNNSNNSNSNCNNNNNNNNKLLFGEGDVK